VDVLVAFRADASVQIGTGHIMRCLTLADELTRQGHECWFICRDHQGHLGELIAGKGFAFNLLLTPGEGDPNPNPNSSKDNGTAHTDWLGVSWQLDAAQTLVLLESLAVDWLVVDHYAIDARWEGEVSEVVGRIMVIDDLADRDHHADMLLDQSALNEGMEKRYRERLNSESTLLLGPHYALLGQEYSFLANVLPERDGQVFRALVFVGGSDPYHFTERYLKALSGPKFRHLLVDVVIGKNHPAPEAVSEITSRRAGTRLYLGLPSLAALMVRADLMLGAGGATNWERMCLGLTSVVVSVARNQDDINRELADQRLIYFLGKAETAAIGDIQTVLLSVLDSVSKNSAQSKAMRKVVDGCGTERVARMMLKARKYDIA
jgi:UDP-2,4-diacetamido-2,4,6-trideoxy-beta-L-altropyranose hydrolase